MDFEVSRKSRDYLGRLGAFMDEHVYPNEERYYLQPAGSRWDEPLFLEDLRHKARAARLWNLFLPDSHHGAGLQQPRLRAAVRDDGPRALSARGLQLRRPGYRQHGDARALRHADSRSGSGSSRCSPARCGRRSR